MTDELTDNADREMIPASMLAAFAFCPRLCYLQFVQGEFQDSAELAEGRFLHRWVDAEQDAVPEEFVPFHARSVSLSAPQAGVCCRIDLLEGDGKSVTPVEYKRGKAHESPAGWYDPQMIQLAAQGLALQENGFSCEHGMIYYILSKERVFVSFDPALMAKTRELIEKLRMMAARGEIPQPLRASARCEHCSLAGVCLPDEVNLLREMEAERAAEGEPEEEKIRMLLASRDDAVPVYVVGQGKTVRKRGERLEVWSYEEGKVSEARIREISKVCLYGGAEITTPAMVELMQRNVPVLHFSHGGWFLGICQGMSHKNVLLRIKQFQWAGDEGKSLSIARKMVAAKIENSRMRLRRYDADVPEMVLDSLATLAKDAENASRRQILLGIEGAAAGAYFSRLGSLLKTNPGDFSFEGRNKRPPRDPVNSVLSYLYGVLTKELFTTVQAAGFEPYLGFYHQPRYGRPALALDMMEEFRPVIADAAMLSLFNNEELTAKDFIRTGIGISIMPEAKRKVIAAYEHRMQTEVTHPIFSYKVSYRRVLEVQSRLLARVLSGELKEYPAFISRG
ncbi:MAG: CRISPR-associated endonuclease Cas1 [Methanothrix sp.]|nr:CRISPR-associated endonuclease Cas1 [Methanothrix sp.]MDD4448312.1 CRISPR-associated endonuclease Cas1 [Methanothrix sp.]